MRFDLHIHSNFSRDGTATPREIAEHCRKLGLDGFAIADHNEIKGSLEAVSYARNLGLLAVRAVEISTNEGHILSYGVSELVPKGLSIRETIDRVHALGGIAVAAHPVRFPSGIGLEATEHHRFDAIEVLNGGNSRRSNGRARRLAERSGKPVTAGSDAHRIDEIGKSYMEMDVASSEDDIISSISRGRARVGGRSRTCSEGVVYSVETLAGWLRGSLKRL